MILKTAYHKLLAKFKQVPGLIQQEWDAIESLHTESHRHYHTLRHLESIYNHLEPQKDQLEDWEAVQFAIFYHDCIYDVTRSDNEEKSAGYAEAVMRKLGVDTARIARCSRHILATKGHGDQNDIDTLLFLDADLAILGADSASYKVYCGQIRKEYGIYPNDAYGNGRAKVLASFLQRPSIFKTSYFIERYEIRARLNIQEELNGLN